MRTYWQVAEDTQNAYSFDRYADWVVVCKKLMSLGLTDNQTEAVVRSKWMRWAADGSSSSYGRVPAKAIVELVKKQGMDEVRELTRETFGLQ